jgi:CheY-like chemotaxis protein
MAANLFGFIGHTRGADVLVGVMDRGGISNPNVRFAILEAFGRIPSLKGLVCLVDALQDPDDMILVAVATGLNHGSNPGAVLKISELLAAKDAQSRRVARAIASARATDLFTSLYENQNAAQVLLEALAEIRDRDTVDTFREVLAQMGSQRAKDDLERLSAIPVEQSMRRVLAVDDSKSVLLFYKTIVSDLGFEVLTAGNGREALDVLEQDPAFDLIITDLNMPEMDGIELTRKIRENFMLSGLPIIMATTESEGSQIQIARNAGVNGFLSKPITPPSIGAMLKDVLG